MDTWVWITIVVVAALALVAVVWWSSGRARLRGRASDNNLTQNQVDETSQNLVRNTVNRAFFGS